MASQEIKATATVAGTDARFYGAIGKHVGIGSLQSQTLRHQGAGSAISTRTVIEAALLNEEILAFCTVD